MNDFLWKSRMHPYHLVNISPWPFTCACGVFIICSGGVRRIHNYGGHLLAIGVLILSITLSLWWRDVTREATFQGKHTRKVVEGLRIGMLLFICREICFFFSFFWSFFHSSLSPGVEISSWPPTGVTSINPFEVPLLNTVVLLASGATITWSHRALLNSNRAEALGSLILTLFLGFFFTLLQRFEYYYCPFSISDSVFGSTFYVATGFHGLHVAIGSFFILVMLFRHSLSHFTKLRHFGFEASAWYWHFVDVVWLLLYTCIYWWGY